MHNDLLEKRIEKTYENLFEKEKAMLKVFAEDKERPLKRPPQSCNSETTTMECERCGLSYKPSLGHKCKLLPINNMNIHKKRFF